MRYFLYDNEGNVKSISEDKIIFDKTIFSLKGFNPTANELELIKQGYQIKVKNNKLEFEKPEQVKRKENVENLKIQIDNAKDLPELKELIKTLL